MNSYFANEKLIECKDTGEVCKGYNEYLNSKHWKTFRLKILSSLECCCLCEEKSSYYHIHHLNYDCLGAEKPKDVRAVCSKCHKIIHKTDMNIKTLKNKYSNKPTKKKRTCNQKLKNNKVLEVTKYFCKHCGSNDVYFKAHKINKGIFCAKCNKWIKWLNKKELFYLQ